MAVFSYKAIDTSRSATSGTVVADSPWQARDTLRMRGLKIQKITEIKELENNSTKVGTGSRRHAAAVISMTRELSTLLAVGVPLTEALETITDQYSGTFREGLIQLRDRVSSGMSFAEAMKLRTDLFDEMTINVVQVGEDAGRLEEVLETLADFKEKWQELSNHVITALIYPAIVMVMATAVSIFLMTFVVPNIITDLTTEGKKLPWVTSIVKICSDTIINHGWWIAPLIIVILAAVGFVFSRGAAQLWWHKMVLKIPLLGQMIRKQATVRMATVVSTLMRSGVSFERAINISKNTTHNRIMRQALESCGKAAYTGTDIAKALEHTEAFPKTVVQVFSVGQESGRLEDMLDRLAADYDRQVYTLARRLTAFIEPITIIILAVIVGTIAFATVLPILEASNVL